MARRYDHIRAKAIELRAEKHLTLDAIVERLQLPRITIYSWIKDIPIPTTEKQTAAQRRRAQQNSQRAAAIRDSYYQEGLAEARELLENPMLRDFVNLYMAEGGKRDRNRVEFVNSDVAMMQLANHWIIFFSENKIRYRLQCHIDNDEEQLKLFWSEKLNIQPHQIKVSRKSNSNQLSGRQWRAVHGVLTIETGDTRFKSRLNAWMDTLRKQWLDFNTESL